MNIMTSLPPELINEILIYLDNDEIDMCLHSHQSFNVLTPDKYIDVKIWNKPLYAYSFVPCITGYDYPVNIYGVSKTLRSATRILIIACIDYEEWLLDNDDDGGIHEWYAEEREDDRRKYIYRCLMNKDKYDPNIMAEYILESIDFASSSIDNVLVTLSEFFYWDEDVWVQMKEVRVLD